MYSKVLTLLASTYLVCAQTTPLSLDEARDRAKNFNRDVLAAKHNAEITAGVHDSNTEYPNPSLGISYAKQRVWPANFDDKAISITQPIPLSGRLGHADSVGTAQENAARFRIADVQRLTDNAIIKAYAEAAAAQAAWDALKATAEAYRQEALIARQRKNAGDLAEIDAARITLAAEAAQVDADNARIRLKAALVALEIYMGANQPTGNLELKNNLAALHPICEQIFATPMGMRYDVEAAKEDLQAAEAGVALEYANRWADPSVSFSYDHNYQTPAYTFGVAISIPLPLLNQNNGAIRAARARATLASSELGRTSTQAAADLTDAEAAWRITAESDRQHREVLLPAAQKIAEAARLAYERGGIALIDYLSTTRDYNTEKLAAIQAAQNFVNAAANLAAAKAQALNYLNPPPSKP